MNETTITLEIKAPTNGTPSITDLQKAFTKLFGYSPTHDILWDGGITEGVHSVTVKSVTIDAEQPKKYLSVYLAGDIVLGEDLPKVPVGSILKGEFEDDNVAIVTRDGIRRINDFDRGSTFGILIAEYKWTLLYVNN